MDEELMNTEADATEVDNASSVENANVADSQMENDSNAEADNAAEAQNEEAQQQIDVNAIAAAARRKAEQQAKEQMNAIDAEFARRFAGYSNPITGQPIRSQSDYLAALDAQKELEAKQELQSKGINPDMINDLINNNPKIRQAEMVMEQANRIQTVNQINGEVAELGTIDPSIKSLNDVPPDVIQMAMGSNGQINLVNAYKILNFGKVSESKQAAITQNAINQAKGKSHLTPVNGVATPDEGVDIPANELSRWQDMFPEKSNKELKALYNKSL